MSTCGRKCARTTERHLWARRCIGGVLAVLVAAPVGAGWLDIVSADAEADLPRARREAIRLIADEPGSADAVAAAAWWFRRRAVLARPDEILDLDRHGMGPQLRVVLADLEADLDGSRPEGVPGVAELAGPFGSFDVLDLERHGVPSEAEVPPIGVDEGRALPMHLPLRFRDGWVGPGEALLRSGVYTAAWTVTVDAHRTGWLILETRSNADLEVDGRVVDRLRPERALEAAVAWYRVDLQPGAHRVRVAFASTGRPRVRVRFLDDDGSALAARYTAQGRASGTAGSKVDRSYPPLTVELLRGLEDESTLEEVLLAAALAAHREEPADHRRWLEMAAEVAPDSPWPPLLLADLLLNAPTGSAAEVDYRRCREQLRRAGLLPGARLLEVALNQRQDRDEDADRLIDELLDVAQSDARVRLLAVRRAVARGWRGEVEHGLGELASLLPGSPTVVSVRVEALKALDRWDERGELLDAVAKGDPFRDGLLVWLVDAGRYKQALTVVEARLGQGDDVDLEIEKVRLLVRMGRLAEAAAAIDAARGRWGPLGELDDLEILARFELNGVDGGREALNQALSRAPGRLDLRRLAWRWGASPFFETWRREPEPLIARARSHAPEETDSVLFLDQAVERLYADGSSLHYYHGLNLALTPRGAQQTSRVTLLDHVELLRLRVFKKDGRILVPPEAGVAAGLELSDIEPGDVVETEYLVEMPATAAREPQHLSPYVYRFADADRAFGLSEYVLMTPKGVAISVDGNLEGVDRSRDMVDGCDVRTFRVEGAPPFFDEPFAPPEQELLPWVTYGLNVEWMDVGDAVRDAVLAMLGSNPELDSWVRARLTEEDPGVAVRSLVEAVLDEVEPGNGAIDPRWTAGQSFSRRRGNRLPILLTALLGNGWSVDLVMSRPQPYAGSHLDVPSMSVFGAPVVRAARDGRAFWIDPGEEQAGIGRVRTLLQGSDGLVLPLDDPAEPVRYLDRIPLFDNPDVEERISLDGRIGEDGSGRLTARVVLRGERGRELAETVRSVSLERAALLFGQIASRMFTGASNVRGRIDTSGERPVLELSFDLEHACEPQDDQLVCRALVVNEPLSPVLASLSERRYPLVLTIPVRRLHKLELELPDGWRVASSERRLAARFGLVEESLETAPGSVTSEIRLHVFAQNVRPKEYGEFVRYCHAVDELMSRPVTLERP